MVTEVGHYNFMIVSDQLSQVATLLKSQQLYMYLEARGGGLRDTCTRRLGEEG